MKKILTVVLDGFGLRDEEHGNAIKMADMPNFNNLLKEYPNSKLFASEEAVGLPKGQFGSSEVGHSTIGAGRRIKQNMTKIDEFIENDIDNDEDFKEMINNIRLNKSNVHLIGLCSPGGVHAHMKHFAAMLKKFKEYNISEVYLHLITDGRDSYIKDSMKFILSLQKDINEIGVGQIATVCGRYYAMDRDERYERTKVMYDLLVNSIGLNTKNLNDTINSCYEKRVTDEFLPPIILNSTATVKDNDIIFWLNYRNDRAIQLLDSLTNKEFKRFNTKKLNNVELYSFFPIAENIKVHSMMEEDEIQNPLGIYLSNLGMTQARIAETEKFPHVTYFFDGGFEGKLPGCDKIEIPSPKVATYDLTPEMSAVEVTKKTISCMEKDYDFILTNFANPDMVGHTGNLDATIKAVETVDLCLGKLLEAAKDNFYTIFILGDHGNAEMMLDENNQIVTTHTTSQVPFIITDTKVSVENGDLTQVAPTILKYMDIASPKEMKDTKTLIK